MANLPDALDTVLTLSDQDPAVESDRALALDIHATPNLDGVTNFSGMVKNHLTEFLGDDIRGSHNVHRHLSDPGIEPAHEPTAKKTAMRIEVREHHQLTTDELKVGLEISGDIGR